MEMFRLKELREKASRWEIQLGLGERVFCIVSGD